jgi:hypothetical protein
VTTYVVESTLQEEIKYRVILNFTRYRGQKKLFTVVQTRNGTERVGMNTVATKAKN